MTVSTISDDVIQNAKLYPKFELNEVDDGDIIIYNDSPVIVKREEKLKFLDINSNKNMLLDSTTVFPDMKFYILGFKDGETIELLEV